jgi:hypothetical protein
MPRDLGRHNVFSSMGRDGVTPEQAAVAQVLAWAGYVGGVTRAVFRPRLIDAGRPPGGFAVRRDWPDGTHDLFGFTRDVRRVLRRLARDGRYWRRGPLRPTNRMVVFLSRRRFDTHGQLCRDPRCVGGRLVARAGAGVRR